MFRNLNATFTTGLIGANRSGKTTLLRLIATELARVSGSFKFSGDAAYLPQKLTLEPA